jgi:hypothetical protein
MVREERLFLRGKLSSEKCFQRNVFRELFSGNTFRKSKKSGRRRTFVQSVHEIGENL